MILRVALQYQVEVRPAVLETELTSVFVARQIIVGSRAQRNGVQTNTTLLKQPTSVFDACLIVSRAQRNGVRTKMTAPKIQHVWQGSNASGRRPVNLVALWCFLLQLCGGIDSTTMTWVDRQKGYGRTGEVMAKIQLKRSACFLH